MSDDVERLRRNYRPALLAYLGRRGENELRSAYEIGRGALAQRISLLDLVQVHHDILLEILPGNAADDLQDDLSAAATFLVEALSTSDMAQRGFLEGSRPGGGVPPHP